MVLCSVATALTIPSGSTDRLVAFVAASGTTRVTGLSSFTVYYKLDDGSVTAMTTPTVTELDSTNMDGDYQLLIDESGMTTLDASHDNEELILHIAASGMDDVTRVITIERTKITEGQSIDAANSAIKADVYRWLATLLTDQPSTLSELGDKVVADVDANSIIPEKVWEDPNALTSTDAADPNAIVTDSNPRYSIGWYLRMIFGGL